MEIEEYADKAKQELDEKNKQQEICLQDIAHRLLNAESEHAKITAEKEKQFDSEENRYQKASREALQSTSRRWQKYMQISSRKTEIRK